MLVHSLPCTDYEHIWPNRVARCFLLFYGQNLNKKWPKLLFFEKVMAKNTKCYNYGNLYNHHKGPKVFTR